MKEVKLYAVVDEENNIVLEDGSFRHDIFLMEHQAEESQKLWKENGFDYKVVELTATY